MLTQISLSSHVFSLSSTLLPIRDQLIELFQ